MRSNSCNQQLNQDLTNRTPSTTILIIAYDLQLHYVQVHKNLVRIGIIPPVECESLAREPAINQECELIW